MFFCDWLFTMFFLDDFNVGTIKDKKGMYPLFRLPGWVMKLNSRGVRLI